MKKEFDKDKLIDVLRKISDRRDLLCRIKELPNITIFQDTDNARRELEFNAFITYALKKLDDIVKNECPKETDADQTT